MRARFIPLIVAVLSLMVAAPAMAKALERTKTAGNYRIELQVLPPEPFYTAQQVSSSGVKSGMLIMRGAKPVAPGAPAHPNHHLIVHVFNRKTGHAITDATVTLSVQRVNDHGSPIGAATEVPVVVMEVIGKGPASTHYGNNVRLSPGHYRVTATVNGVAVPFQIVV